MRQSIENINTIPTEQNHQGTAFLKRLIKFGEGKGELQTFNYAWIKKGFQLDPHTHEDCIEYFYFLSGSGEMLIGENWFGVGQGDFVTVPSKNHHSLKNTYEEDLIFLTMRILI